MPWQDTKWKPENNSNNKTKGRASKKNVEEEEEEKEKHKTDLNGYERRALAYILRRQFAWESVMRNWEYCWTHW